jgi:molecular chaperone GrpE
LEKNLEVSEQLANNPSTAETMNSNEINVDNYAQTATNPEVEAEESATTQLITETTDTQNYQEVIAALQEQVALLKQQLDEQTEKTENFKTQYIRIAADFDNFRKRTSKDKETLQSQVKRNTILELLSVIDNFERARNQIKPNTEGEKGIHKSYQGVYKILVDSLKRIGVSPMRPENQPFDPNYHEAMLREPTDEYPEGTVMEELVRGYLIDEQVLRHAMVKVAAPKEEVEETATETEEN